MPEVIDEKTGEVLNETNFLNVGDLVVAKMRVYDLPGNPDPGPIAAEKGEMGICIDRQPNHCPTVQFFRTRHITDVFPDEVERLRDFDAIFGGVFGKVK